MPKKVVDTLSIKNTISKYPGKTKKELASILGIKLTTFNYHYKKLLFSGDIKKIDDQTKITEEIIKDLEYWFTHWLTDEQACFKVGITTSAFYNYCKQNIEWANRRKVIKTMQYMKAKILVSKKLQEENDDYIKMVYKIAMRREVRERIEDLKLWKKKEEYVRPEVSLNLNFW